MTPRAASLRLLAAVIFALIAMLIIAAIAISPALGRLTETFVTATAPAGSGGGAAAVPGSAAVTSIADAFGATVLGFGVAASFILVLMLFDHDPRRGRFSR